MKHSDDPHGKVWEKGWDGHRLEQQRRLATLPLWVRIEWLEETQRLLQNLARSHPDDRRPRGR